MRTFAAWNIASDPKVDQEQENMVEKPQNVSKTQKFCYFRRNFGFIQSKRIVAQHVVQSPCPLEVKTATTIIVAA